MYKSMFYEPQRSKRRGGELRRGDRLTDSSSLHESLITLSSIVPNNCHASEVLRSRISPRRRPVETPENSFSGGENIPKFARPEKGFSDAHALGEKSARDVSVARKGRRKSASACLYSFSSAVRPSPLPCSLRSARRDAGLAFLAKFLSPFSSRFACVSVRARDLRKSRSLARKTKSDARPAVFLRSQRSARAKSFEDLTDLLLLGRQNWKSNEIRDCLRRVHCTPRELLSPRHFFRSPRFR